MKTSWKPIPGYEGTYEISRSGHVRSLGRVVITGNGGRRVQETRVLRRFLSGPETQYYKVALSKNGVTKAYAVHRLVAKAFIPNPHDHPIVLHNNGVSTDIRVENLRWGTQAENIRDSYKHCPIRVRGHHRVSRQMTQDIQDSDKTLAQLSAIYGLHQTTISRHRHKPL